MLYIVVEPDGVYIGKERVPPDEFADYLRARTRLFSPDYFIIAGTDAAQFGDVVRAFDAARGTFRVDYMMETRPLPTGTRRPRIRVAQNFWDY
ncbi:MAG: hypothetical protein HYV96_16675 [Opitutae bacterium]|nr:hypothetical protein [Opitutae bacterium]